MKIIRVEPLSQVLNDISVNVKIVIVKKLFLIKIEFMSHERKILSEKF